MRTPFVRRKAKPTLAMSMPSAAAAVMGKSGASSVSRA